MVNGFRDLTNWYIVMQVCSKVLHLTTWLYYIPWVCWQYVFLFKCAKSWRVWMKSYWKQNHSNLISFYCKFWSNKAAFLESCSQDWIRCLWAINKSVHLSTMAGIRILHLNESYIIDGLKMSSSLSFTTGWDKKNWHIKCCIQRHQQLEAAWKPCQYNYLQNVALQMKT